jgi:hypothetical protein
LAQRDLVCRTIEDPKIDRQHDQNESIECDPEQ